MSEVKSKPVSAVPAFDLGRAVKRIESEVEERWRRLLGASAFVGGDEVARFETAFAAVAGTEACAAVANGTDALELAVRALGLEPGDEVIVPSFTFIATASAVVLAGGRPVIVDVESETLNLDLAAAAAAVTERTVGIIGVHLYGRPFDVEGARALCREHGLWLVEDAAQAHGAAMNGRPVGSFGDLATWSFYPTKNLGCFGDGGAVTGAREPVERTRLLANHGAVARYDHAEVGRNSRFDALQAAVVLCRLPRLEDDNRRRREIACRYQGGLDGVGDLRFPVDPEGAFSVFHQMTVLTGRRDELQAVLAAAGIGTSVHYPMGLHEQQAFAGLVGDVELPVSTAAGREALCLPIFPELTDAEVDRVCAAIREFFDTR